MQSLKSPTRTFDLAVIGAGPAGCSAAITAARAGLAVVLLDKSQFPRQKVCGEFVSAESLQLLRRLLSGEDSALNPLIDSAPQITSSRVFVDGEVIRFPVTPPAASISRFDLDLALWNAAKGSGVDCREQYACRGYEKSGKNWVIESHHGEIQATALIDASGRWSNLRSAELSRAPGDDWIGVKQHFFEADAPSSSDLYFFEGGYCGIQRLDARRINVCAMARSSVATSLPEIFAKSQPLWLRSRAWEPAAEPFATAPLIFRQPLPICDGVLRVGDAAAFIDPFVGDGISLALRSGTLAAICVLDRTISATSAQRYLENYSREFGSAFRSAARLRRLTRLPKLLRKAAITVLQQPSWAEWAVASTR